jgi:hypothetical protein
MNPPPTDALVAALRVLDVPAPDIESFTGRVQDDLAWEFTQTLCESPQAIVTDWKFHPSDVLAEIFLRLYPLGTKAMIEAEDAETLFPTKVYLETDGVGSRWSAKIPEEPDLNEVVFAFRATLPDTVRIYTLSALDGTDTYGHVVAATDVWSKLAEVLGPWFTVVFRDQTPTKPLFKRVGKDVKPKRDFLKKHIKDMRDWPETAKASFDKMHQDVLDVLDIRLDSPYLQHVPGLGGLSRSVKKQKMREWNEFVTSPRRLVLVNGSQWAGHAGAQGLLALWDKKPDGWTKLRQTLEHFYWEVAIELRFKKVDNQFFGCGDFGTRLALAIVLGEWLTADYFCQQMLRIKNFYVASSPLSRFLIKMYSLLNPKVLEGVTEPGKSYGVYGAVFAAWHDPPKLAAALEMACDYHMMRIGDDHEFSWSPFYAFAAEIFAVYRVRQKLGLPTPVIDHQLLNAPWRKYPEHVPLEADAILDRIQRVVQNEVPDMLTR